MNEKLICYADRTTVMNKVELGTNSIKIYLNGNLLLLTLPKTKFVSFDPYKFHLRAVNSFETHYVNCIKGAFNCP